MGEEGERVSATSSASIAVVQYTASGSFVVTDASVDCELGTSEHFNADGMLLKRWTHLPADFDQPFTRGKLSSCLYECQRTTH